MSERIGIAELERAVAIIGGQEATGIACGVRQSAISECLRNGKKVPAEWCIPLERATADKGAMIARGEFRPDIYPREIEAAHGKSPVRSSACKRMRGAANAEQAPRNAQPRVVAR